jgi:hypothetical protein
MQEKLSNHTEPASGRSGQIYCNDDTTMPNPDNLLQSSATMPFLTSLENGPSMPTRTRVEASHCYPCISTTGPFNGPTTSASLGNVEPRLHSVHLGSTFSEYARDKLLGYINYLLRDVNDVKASHKKDIIIGCDMPEGQQVLSLHMMQTYVSSYWDHVHPQLPILHKPTFNASTCPKLLLVVIMCLGACCLGTDSSQELANLLAWEMRYELLKEADSSLDGQLCALQGLFLLEIFEKRYSTRRLYDRARDYSGKILDRMRRLGFFEEHLIPESVTSNESWRTWVKAEATRRLVFAAVLMDRIDTVQLGSSANVRSLEIKLCLPCAEDLWAAPYDSWVNRTQPLNNTKPALFVEGLRKMMRQEPIQISSFGRIVLMADLLAVPFGAEQECLLLTPFPQTAARMRNEWREQLSLAFDFWKQDFDSALNRSEDCPASSLYGYSHGIDDDNVFESRIIIYHLAHMATHVDIADCQIYAGATRLPGRSITLRDYNDAQRRMKEVWAPTARARHATFHALRFLRGVMVAGDDSPNPNAPSSAVLSYSARDDYPLNRPWVLYFATLIVWSYGFALDGPVKERYPLPSYEDKVKDMVLYLNRMGGVRTPEDLSETPNRNACLGLLIIMRDMFKQTRRELLQEAGDLLTECIKKLDVHRTEE